MAVATPCWPAPVSAMTRFLPIRFASSACPSALLILWAPVWQQVLALEETRPPRRSDRRVGVAERRRPADVVAQEAVELGPEGRVAPRLAVRRLELVERRHQRLGHEAAAERAEVPGGVRPSGERRLHASSRHALRPAHRPHERRTFAGSLSPGAASTPATRRRRRGRTRRTASATFVGRRARRRAQERAALASARRRSAQSNVSPGAARQLVCRAAACRRGCRAAADA